MRSEKFCDDCLIAPTERSGDRNHENMRKLRRILAQAIFPKGSMLAVSNIAHLVLSVLLAAIPSYGYTVLTHEAIIDSVWDASIQKLLLKRFPDATPEELNQAHAYAYGGSIIQDMGYYPF